MKRWLREWGLLFLLLQCVASFFKLMQSKVAMHYAVFTGAVPFLWRGENPFIQLYIPGNDEQRYLYSPTFAIIFAPFYLVPEPWGRSGYVLGSLALLAWGVLFWMRTADKIHGRRLSTHPWRNWALLLIGSEIFGAVYFTKIEVAQLGILFFVLGWLLRGHVTLPFFLLGFLGEFKFQTLPVLGLSLLVAIFVRGNVARAALAGIAGFLSAAVLPLLLMSPSALSILNHSRFEQIDRILITYWTSHYQSVFKTFLTLGLPVTLGMTKAVSLVAAACFAGLLWGMVREWKRRYSAVEVASFGYLAALAMGLIFNLLFSPMSQTNAFLFLAPLAVLVLITDPEAKSPTTPFLFFASLILISVLYSDLVPRSVNLWARQWAVKPWGLLFLLAAASKRAHLLSGRKSAR